MFHLSNTGLRIGKHTEENVNCCNLLESNLAHIFDLESVIQPYPSLTFALQNKDILPRILISVVLIIVNWDSLTRGLIHYFYIHTMEYCSYI